MTIIKSITIKQIIYAILIVIWMAVVFSFSNEPAVKSSKTSDGLTDKVIEVITKKDPEKKKKINRSTIETIVRKSAHFMLYTIGGFLIAGLVATTNVGTKKLFIYAVLFTTLYACTDEIHQIFVEGRSCELRDILIDGVGAMLGTGLFLFCRKMSNDFLNRIKSITWLYNKTYYNKMGGILWKLII